MSQIKYITVKLTEDQANMVKSLIEDYQYVNKIRSYDEKTPEQRKEWQFTQRVLDKLAKAKTV